MLQLQILMRTVWHYLRDACGENDYERYRAHVGTLGIQTMSPAAFYVSQLQHKYSRPQRCC